MLRVHRRMKLNLVIRSCGAAAGSPTEQAQALAWMALNIPSQKLKEHCPIR